MFLIWLLNETLGNVLGRAHGAGSGEGQAPVLLGTCTAHLFFLLMSIVCVQHRHAEGWVSIFCASRSTGHCPCCVALAACYKVM